MLFYPFLWFSNGVVASVAMKKPEKTDTTEVGPRPKWLEGDHHQNSRQSKGHELRLAKLLGGKRYAGSGNRKWSRYTRGRVHKVKLKVPDTRYNEDTSQGDIATPKFHLEHKFTRASSMVVQLDWLAKVEEGAKRVMKDPGLIFTFQDSLGKPRYEYVAIPLEVFARLMRKLEAECER
jgi:hypothetical protein